MSSRSNPCASDPPDRLVNLAMRFGMQRWLIAASLVVSVRDAGATPPLPPELAKAPRAHWIGEMLKHSDVVLLARVERVELRTQPKATLGDWAYIVAGTRLGLGEHDSRVTLALASRVSLKGASDPSTPVFYDVRQPGPSELFSEVGYAPHRIVEGRKYVLFCRRAADALEVVEFADAAEQPKLAQDVLDYVLYGPVRESEERPMATTVCELVSRPGQYQGALVKLSADVESDGIHGIVLVDRACPTRGLSFRSSESQASFPGSAALSQAMFDKLSSRSGEKQVAGAFVGRFEWREKEVPRWILHVSAVSGVKSELASK